jgi:hypothetical protein
MKTRLVRNQTQKRSRMIKNLIVFFSISGAMVLLFNIMNKGLGKRWDELGLVLFVIILFLTIIKEDK